VRTREKMGEQGGVEIVKGWDSDTLLVHWDLNAIQNQLCIMS
jgi:hypothetical protein